MDLKNIRQKLKFLSIISKKKNKKKSFDDLIFAHHAEEISGNPISV